MTRLLRLIAAAGLAALAGLQPAMAQSPPPAYGQQLYDAQGRPVASPPPPAYAPPPAEATTYSSSEILSEGHRIFGEVSQGLATVVEHAFASYGLPNGYIIGQEGSAAIIGGARYGEGVLYTKNAGQHRVFWQGPSVGLDVGANGDRTMMLVYNLPSIDAMYDRFVGVNGSAYAVAGIGMTVLSRRGIFVVPIVSGVGARLGVNFGYLKFTTRPTWNPF